MSAAVLREAAALMRERAEVATQGPWEAYGSPIALGCFMVGVDDEQTSVADPVAPANAEHIASWHPAVALAVADMLGAAADDHDETPCPAIDAALTVARAYLGRES